MNWLRTIMRLGALWAAFTGGVVAEGGGPAGIVVFYAVCAIVILWLSDVSFEAR